MGHITTYTKIHVDPLYPNPDDIDIRDIAHALSLLCRAGGHFRSFYSVGQHSINCLREAKARGYSEKVQLACLLHDAGEAYLSDITRPVKSALPQYQEYENTLLHVIWEKWLDAPLTGDEYEKVFSIDDAMLYYEFEQLMGETVFAVRPELTSHPSLEFTGFADTEQKFLRCFYEFFRTEKPTVTVGVDGIRGKWIAVIQRDGALDFRIFNDIATICETYSDVDAMLIDMPIGLPENKEEDQLRPEWVARKLVKGKSSSFFAPPYRPIVYAKSEQERVALEKQLGKGNSKQTLALCSAIKQVDLFLQSNPAWKNRLQESHPELAFFALNGKKPLQYSKQKPEGIRERIAVLRQYCDVDGLVNRHLTDVPHRKKLDDLLDALSLAVIGKLGLRDGFAVLPRFPARDSAGLTMQMVYWDSGRGSLQCIQG